MKMIDGEIESIRFSQEFADLLKSLFRETVRIKNDDEGMTESAISREIGKLKARKAQLVELYLDQDIDRESLKTLTEKCEQDIQRFEDDMRRVRVNKDDFVCKMTDVIDSIYKLPALFTTAGKKDKAEILRAAATGIEVFDDGVQVCWDLPFAFILNKEVMPYAGMTSDKVRKLSRMLPQEDDLRTIIYQKSLDAQLWHASKTA